LGLIAGAAPAQAQQAASLTSPGHPALASLADEAQIWLADLIRINTTNPPGNELAATYVGGILRRENIPVEILELAPGLGVVIARLQAGPIANSSRALLLLAHLDVVGVDASKWTVDPFAGVVKDGHLYGRGAIDSKGMVVANLASFIALKRAGVRLGRDVIFLATADEEQGGTAGIRVLIDKHWDKIACSFAINEGGRVIVRDGKPHHVAVQTSEKVPHNVSVVATGAAAHASVPNPDSAVLRLTAAIQKIGAYQPPLQPMTLTRRYFEKLAPVEGEERGRWMRALEMPSRQDLAALRLSEMSPVWSSMLHDSVAVTELRAGIRSNIVPSEASANLNVRLLPGNSIDAFVAQLQKAVNDPQVRFTVDRASGVSAPPSSSDSELFRAIEIAAGRQFPGIVTAPYLSPGATDSAELRLRNVQALGLLPFPLTEADAGRMHGDDERLPISSFRAGVEFLYRVVHEFVAAK
jgi:acetylornithine deacetylase/succinyl-diaminopimelate desuccinylase-like protein